MLHFAKGNLPPVKAFWSLTMYDLPTQLLVANPLNRYLLNSPMLPGMTRDADGGLTLCIQQGSPGKDKESNWLPVLSGLFYLMLRSSWPQHQIVQGKWKAPPLEKSK